MHAYYSNIHSQLYLFAHTNCDNYVYTHINAHAHAHAHTHTHTHTHTVFKNYVTLLNCIIMIAI